MKTYKVDLVKTATVRVRASSEDDALSKAIAYAALHDDCEVTEEGSNEN